MFVAALLSAGTLALHEAEPAAAAVTSVRGYACGYITNVGLFGAPQAKLGCAPQIAGGSVVPSASTLAPSVTLASDGSNSPQLGHDADGAAGTYGPATVVGGIWPCDPPGGTNCPDTAPPTGPITVSTAGTPAGGTVTAATDIDLYASPIVVPCYEGYPGPCTVPGGIGPLPVEADDVHVECSASEGSVTGSTTFVDGILAVSTDANGNPLISEPIPDNPPVNYTRNGVISNVGDVFTVVFNEHIVNSDGSLTVNAVHMYLFGSIAVGEAIKGTVTCGTTPSPLSPPSDTVAPTCGQPVVKPLSATNPAPQVPRTELMGVFDTGLGDAGGLNQITNIQITNGTLQVGNPSGLPYLQFLPPQRNPLPIVATRTPEAESADLPMRWSLDAIDAAGNVTHCDGSVVDEVPADFNGNARTDISVFRPSTGTWLIQDGKSVEWGTSGDRAVPADYNGNRVTDIAVYRPSRGFWFLFDGTIRFWGSSGDLPVPANYDGDTDADLAVYRPSSGTWYVRGTPAVNWGAVGDVPVPGNYDGDGDTDIAVFRPSSGTWFVRGGAITAWGTDGDIPVPGDYDGDGDTDIAVFRPSTGTWFVQGGATTAWGADGDIPVPGNYDGDADTDIAVYRPSTATWFVHGGAITAWGTGGDLPLPLADAIRSVYF